jgi:uncharacterized membrane protein
MEDNWILIAFVAWLINPVFFFHVVFLSLDVLLNLKFLLIQQRKYPTKISNK